MSGSSLALAAEVGDPLGRVIVAVVVATVAITVGFATPLLGLTLLALLALFALPFPLLLALLLALLLLLQLFLFFRVFAGFVTDVLVWEVAFGRPHVIMRGAAKSKRENAQAEIVEATNCH